MTGRIISRTEVERLRAAELVISEAKESRKQTLEEAEVKKQEILEGARARALKESAQAATRLIVDAEISAERRLKALEPELARMVSETVTKIIGSMETDDAVIRATTQALVRLRNHRRARILVAPDVADAVCQAVANLSDNAAEIVDVQVDPRLEPGRTILSSDLGHVEIGLPAQMEAATSVWQDTGSGEGEA